LTLRRSLLILALCLPIAAIGQSGPHDDDDDDGGGSHRDDDVVLFDGVWNVRFDGGGSAVLDLRDWDGFWTEKGRAVMPAVCQGKKLPLTVQGSTPDRGLSFTVFGTSVNLQCPDLSYRFKPVDARTMRATLKSGGTATMKLVRKRKQKP
jgi:hypothetical protein